MGFSFPRSAKGIGSAARNRLSAMVFRVAYPLPSCTGMKTLQKILPVLAFVMILGPPARRILRPEEPAPVATAVRVSVTPPPPEAPPATASDWFDAIRANCTPAHAQLAVDLSRPPEGTVSTGYQAACFAIAADVPKARALILGLPEGDRLQAASVVFNVAQAMVERGQEMGAGPLMELVLEFWPNHYVALFEAGVTRYAEGDYTHARIYLQRFLDVYVQNDQRTQRALRMIDDMTER